MSIYFAVYFKNWSKLVEVLNINAQIKIFNMYNKIKCIEILATTFYAIGTINPIISPF